MYVTPARDTTTQTKCLNILNSFKHYIYYLARWNFVVDLQLKVLSKIVLPYVDDYHCNEQTFGKLKRSRDIIAVRLFLVNLYCLYASSVIVCLFHVFLLYISVCLSVLLFLYCFYYFAFCQYGE